jgi:hypothetical protein
MCPVAKGLRARRAAPAQRKAILGTGYGFAFGINDFNRSLNEDRTVFEHSQFDL